MIAGATPPVLRMQRCRAAAAEALSNLEAFLSTCESYGLLSVRSLRSPTLPLPYRMCASAPTAARFRVLACFYFPVFMCALLASQ